MNIYINQKFNNMLANYILRLKQVRMSSKLLITELERIKLARDDYIMKSIDTLINISYEDHKARFMIILPSKQLTLTNKM